MKYTITYTGYETRSVQVEATSQDEAEAKFWDDGLNDLEDAEIGTITGDNQL